MYHGRVTYMDAINMPVFLRRWWISKINETQANEDEATKEAQKLQQQHRSGSQRR